MSVPKSATAQRPARAPRPLRLRLRRLWRRLSRLAGRQRARVRAWRRSRIVLQPPNWRARRTRVRIARWVAWAGLAILVAWLGRALYTTARGEPVDVLGFNPDAACEDISFSCGVAAGLLTTMLSLALASAIFLFWRLRHVEHPYAGRAQRDPRDLVPTAGSIIDEVVGRDELCRVIMADLRDREARRPHMVVGGVGSGKTAVLVRLTKLLAEHGAVPVAIRLRDAQRSLDFRGLARERFVAEAQDQLLSDAEGEKVWRQLLKDDRIVVLADGLEEALAEPDVERDRDNLIRLAIRGARRQNLPLVIASRPHDPLTGADAAIIELDALSEDAALDYIGNGARRLEAQRLEWVVETANVVEAPLYLQVARELHQRGLLQHAYPGDPDDHLDTRGVDRVELRVRLLETWIRGLIRGHFHAELPLSERDREATIDQIAALACVGLKQDSLHVKFEDLIPKNDERSARDGRPGDQLPGVAHPQLLQALVARLARLGARLDIRLAATRGMSLGLVETYADGVRFHHSILQAYLGSRLLGSVLRDDRFMARPLANPGREFLVALVMHAHRGLLEAGEPVDRRRSRTQRRSPVSPPRGDWSDLRGRLTRAAQERPPDAKTLDLLSTALQVDALDRAPAHPAICAQLKDVWGDVQAEDRTIEESKINVIARYGEVARHLTERRELEPGAPIGGPDYRRLYEIARAERSYPVRLAAAHEIGSGGDDAFAAVHPGAKPEGATGDDLPGLLRRWEDDDVHRELVLQAWLAPLLAGSADRYEVTARRVLDDWLALVPGAGSDRGAAHLPLSLEVALAQGFKYAANRRAHHPHARAEAREALAESAMDMLKRSEFWFCRLTLLHALCLWALPDSDELPEAETEPPAARRRRTTSRPRSRAIDPEALVRHWTTLPGGQTEHPFVLEARDLAVRAIETGDPGRFIWIDESGVATTVGSASKPRDGRRGPMWIPASTGWTALDGRAQQLVADVLLLLNLAERGQRPADRERRLQRARRNDLPPCLSEDRRHLDPGRTVGMVKRSPPGSNCRDGCAFDLCPYPPKGEQPYRVELSEAFCRRQQQLLDRRSARTAPWQAALAKELKAFWIEMERRARR